MERIFARCFEDDFTITMYQKLLLTNGNATSVSLEEMARFMTLFEERLAEKGFVVKNDASQDSNRFFQNYAGAVEYRDEDKSIQLNTSFESFVRVFPVGAYSLKILLTMMDDLDIGRAVFDKQELDKYSASPKPSEELDKPTPKTKSQGD